MAIRFAKQIEQAGIGKEEMIQKIRQRGCHDIAYEWDRGFDTVIRYAKEELGIPDPPLYGKDSFKDTGVIRRECVLEMYSLLKEYEERYHEAMALLREKQDEAEKSEAIKRLDYMDILNDVREKRNALRAEAEA